MDPSSPLPRSGLTPFPTCQVHGLDFVRRRKSTERMRFFELLTTSLHRRSAAVSASRTSRNPSSGAPQFPLDKKSPARCLRTDHITRAQSYLQPLPRKALLGPEGQGRLAEPDDPPAFEPPERGAARLPRGRRHRRRVGLGPEQGGHREEGEDVHAPGGRPQGGGGRRHGALAPQHRVRGALLAHTRTPEY